MSLERALHKLVILGMNHRSAPMEVRERIALAPHEAREIMGSACHANGVETASLLSTCNRTEICALPLDDKSTPEDLLQLLEQARPDVTNIPTEHWYLHRGFSAVRHLLRVSSGLDSMILGEPQVLGQLKSSFQMYCDTKNTHPLFHKIYSLAFHCGKRVRAETGLGKGEVSVASAAASLALKIFGSLSKKRALLIGTGETGRLVARYLVDRQVRELLVTNRTASRAQALANELGGQATPFEAMRDELVNADMAVFCTESPDFLLESTELREIMPQRSNRTLFLIDLGVPRNCDPSCEDIDNVFLYNVDNLQNLANLNMANRNKEVANAEGIVEEVLDEFKAWHQNLQVEEVIRALMTKAESQRAHEVEINRKRFEQEHWKDLDALTRAVVKRILYSPLMSLKDDAAQKDRVINMEAVRKVFDLYDDADDS
jgi:glutamyl-tRNA reductase